MKLHMHSYRYAKEILEHPTHRAALDEIEAAVKAMPLFLYPGKSAKKPKLDVVQQLLNTYFDRVLGRDRGWDYHPRATDIPDSKLAADFRKAFPGLVIQAEVQFGNMSRWYSDIFKFQTAYSQSLIDLALCVVPMASLAKRIDSNVAYYERVCRELPSAELSITIPILVIGVEPDEGEVEIDVRRIGIPLKQLTGKGRRNLLKRKTHTELNRYRVVHSVLSGDDPYAVTDRSDHGPLPHAQVEGADDDEDDDDDD